MELLCTPVKVNEEEMRQLLSREGKFALNSVIVHGKEIVGMELRYVEYFVMKYHMIHDRRPLFSRKNAPRQLTQTVYLLGNGSTGAVSHMDADPLKVTQEVASEQIQRADYSADSMQRTAKTTMLKMFRQHVGGWIPSFELLDVQSLYRPFWLIYYNSTRKDGRRLCSIRAADGYQVGKR